MNLKRYVPFALIVTIAAIVTWDYRVTKPANIRHVAATRQTLNALPVPNGSSFVEEDVFYKTRQGHVTHRYVTTEKFSQVRDFYNGAFLNLGFLSCGSREWNRDGVWRQARYSQGKYTVFLDYPPNGFSGRRGYSVAIAWGGKGKCR